MKNLSFDTLLTTEIAPFIYQVTLNRPQARNAINSIMMQELHSLWITIERNQEKIRCIIITGSGDKAFCAGADLKERQNITFTKWQQQHIALEQAMIAMTNCSIPIIAAINGATFGGGLELLLASDFAYASNNANFAQSETKLGIIPGAMGTQNLPRACGIRKAKELCFTGETFTAEQALMWGIINKICPPELLMDEVTKTARLIAQNAPVAIKQAKKALNTSQWSEIHSGYFHEIECYYRAVATQDRVEGIQAFIEKRDPKFSGD